MMINKTKYTIHTYRLLLCLTDGQNMRYSEQYLEGMCIHKKTFTLQNKCIFNTNTNM